MNRILFSLLLITTLPLAGYEKKERLLHSSIDPTSAIQHLAYYELFPRTPLGRQALHNGMLLLGSNSEGIPEHSLEGIFSLIQKLPDQDTPSLDATQLDTIEKLGCHLSNRKLKGHKVASEQELLQLPPDEIDLARAVLLSQIEGEENAELKIRRYEAVIDLMALQIASKLPKHATPKQKIRAISTFIFDEMGFRFPPHSKYAQDIDLYTFLPSVLDSRHGVCLGVSILYLSIAQRLDLPLEAVTPPGHIYIRYRDGNQVINIETTARGIHIDSEEYLGIDTRSLQMRNLKEVIGLEHINNASGYIKNEDYAGALKCYEKALPYLKDDPQIKELMGLCHLFCGNTEKGKAYLVEVKDHQPEYTLTRNTAIEDYFNGAVGIDGIRAVMFPVDEKRASILKKKDALENTVALYPKFREGWLSLAISWLQLNRIKEGLSTLEHFHILDPNNATAEYYLSVLYSNRLNDKKAWEHLRNAESLTQNQNHYPKALKNLRRHLAAQFPE